MPASSLDQHRAALPQRAIEMFGLPGDICPDAVCRRNGRCRSCAPQGPACLALLGPEERAFYKRLLIFAQDFDRELPSLVTSYCRFADDPFLMLVGEVVRRARPRGHWLHRSLPLWYRHATGRPRPVLSLQAAMKAPRRYY
ncbi:hypothetical protein JNB71_02705 [Rhizobium herbae]|uniref:Uncharacterized protein n=1 Tax=Rhizobium herbae TaxID=508661 RepID=A0ABS7H7G1_9HYPH|nr:hypothetical protein [Rhizobium herbae]MBW9062218.1 hypothetical protein [Rhizobium herbae]